MMKRTSTATNLCYYYLQRSSSSSSKLNHQFIQIFQLLPRESEYAAWTLENGFKLNSEGGVLKVSPDGLLLQSSTVADIIQFEYSDGYKESVPCSYIEFAQRLVLPQYKDLPLHKVEEVHRLDGFEVGNADKIFESTSLDQLTRRG